jgi:hypothetical protein
MADVIIRFFVDGNLQGQPRTINEHDAEQLVNQFIEQHATELHMVEFEFPEAPLEERFLRVGTDKRMMIDPIEFDLGEA